MRILNIQGVFGKIPVVSPSGNMMIVGSSPSFGNMCTVNLTGRVPVENLGCEPGARVRSSYSNMVLESTQRY